MALAVNGKYHSLSENINSQWKVKLKRVIIAVLKKVNHFHGFSSMSLSVFSLVVHDLDGKSAAGSSVPTFRISVCPFDCQVRWKSW